jgi:hypothetical protein
VRSPVVNVDHWGLLKTMLEVLRVWIERGSRLRGFVEVLYDE